MTIRLFFLVPLLFIFLGLSAQNTAQTNFKEGFIVYEIKPATDSEFSELFRETTLTLYIKGSKSKLDLKMMGGFAEMQLLASDSQDFVALLNIPMLSEKVNISLKSDEALLGAFIVNRSPIRMRKAEYYYSDQTCILGKKAYKVIAPVKNSRQKISLYLSRKLKTETPDFIEKHIGALDGLPLQAEMTIYGQKIIITAKEIRKTKIKDSVFDVPEDYKQKTLKELKEEFDNFGVKKSEKGA